MYKISLSIFKLYTKNRLNLKKFPWSFFHSKILAFLLLLLFKSTLSNIFFPRIRLWVVLLAWSFDFLPLLHWCICFLLRTLNRQICLNISIQSPSTLCFIPLIDRWLRITGSYAISHKPPVRLVLDKHKKRKTDKNIILLCEWELARWIFFNSPKSWRIFKDLKMFNSLKHRILKNNKVHVVDKFYLYKKLIIKVDLL